MAFSTEFVMGAGGPGIDLNVYEQTVTLPSGGTPVGEPYVVDKAGVYAVAGFGNLGSTANTMRLELQVNGATVGTGAASSDEISISYFLPMYLVAGDTITMRGSASGLGAAVLSEPLIAVAPVETAGDGAVHTGGPVELDRDQWTTLESHTAARSGVLLVDYGVTLASASNVKSRIAVNGQERIGNPVREASDRWYRLLSVNAGDVVEAQALSTAFSASSRVVNNWTITFH